MDLYDLLVIGGRDPGSPSPCRGIRLLEPLDVLTSFLGGIVLE